MIRKLFIVAVLGISTSAALVATGCASKGSDQPYALTGDNLRTELNERQRWTDDKGRYRADWRYGKNAPYGFPKPAAK